MATFKAFTTRPAPDEIKQYCLDQGVELICWTEPREPTAKELGPILKDCQGLLCVGFFPLNEEFISNNSHLRTICTFSVGYDHISIPTASKHNIAVGHTPDVLSNATANTAFLLMQMAARRAVQNYHRITQGKWATEFTGPLDYCGVNLEGKTLGIFGMGRIGVEMAKFCKNAFNMKIIYHNRNRNCQLEKVVDAEYVSFDELCSQSDVVSLHANSTAENNSVFNKSAFDKMKKHSILVNTARGAMVNEDDLLVAVQNDHLLAGLDVFAVEPMKPDHPFVAEHRIAILPHIGSAIVDTRLDMWKLSVNNLIAGVKGEKLPACVNPTVQQ